MIHGSSVGGRYVISICINIVQWYACALYPSTIKLGNKYGYLFFIKLIIGVGKILY